MMIRIIWVIAMIMRVMDKKNDNEDNNKMTIIMMIILTIISPIDNYVLLLLLQQLFLSLLSLVKCNSRNTCVVIIFLLS